MLESIFEFLFGARQSVARFAVATAKRTFADPETAILKSQLRLIREFKLSVNIAIDHNYSWGRGPVVDRLQTGQTFRNRYRNLTIKLDLLKIPYPEENDLHKWLMFLSYLEDYCASGQLRKARRILR